MLRQSILSLGIATQLLLAQSIYAAADTYQVTGPILEVTDKMIVVQKGTERWEIARDENTKFKGELKVGQKVTVHYRMFATSIEKKPSQEPKK